MRKFNLMAEKWNNGDTLSVCTAGFIWFNTIVSQQNDFVLVDVPIHKTKSFLLRISYRAAFVCPRETWKLISSHLLNLTANSEKHKNARFAYVWFETIL